MDITPFLPDALALNTAIIQLQQADAWEVRYRHLLQLPKLLPSLPTEYCIPDYEITGCQSKTWLFTAVIDGHFYALVQSKAKVIQGLSLVLLQHVNGQPVQDLHTLDAARIFDAFQLSKHISTSRSNGLSAIVDRLNTYITQLL